MTFSETDDSRQPRCRNRVKRQLAEQAIAQRRGRKWAEAADTNRKLLELGPEADAENRLAKALWEQGELGAAREHYQAALALDPTNRIAERNIDRLRTLLVAAGEKTVPAQEGSKAPVRIFVEETGKTGFAHLLTCPTRRSWRRSTRATRSSCSPRATGSSRTATACASASSSRASRPGCSSSSPTATSTSPA